MTVDPGTREFTRPPVDRRDIVVGLDDDPAARAATSWAIAEARATGRRVALVRAFDVGSAGGWDRTGLLQQGLTDLFRSTVDDAVAAARREAGGDVDIRGLIRLGRPVTVMAELSGRAEQTVIGIRPRSLTSRLLLGSMGHHLIRTSTRPVVLVPIPADRPASAAPTERVVVAVGGVTGSAAIEHGFRTADARGWPLTLLHAAGQTDDPGSDADVARKLAAIDVISAAAAAHPAVAVTLTTAEDDLETALAHLVGPRDLLVLGHRVPERPRPPVVDRLLLPLLRRPHQVVVVVADPLAEGDGADDDGADDLAGTAGAPVAGSR